MKYSILAACIGGLLSLLSFTAGCTVESKGLASHQDASDTAKPRLDVPPTDGWDAAVPPSDVEIVDALRGDAVVLGKDLAVTIEVALPGPDLGLVDSVSVVDIPAAVETQAAPDVSLPDVSRPDAEIDRNLSPQTDTPVIAPMDTLVSEVAPSDDAPIDLTYVDLAPPDLPVPLDVILPDAPDLALDLTPDVALDVAPDVAPDMAPDMAPDVGPQPTSEWVIDNTSNIGGYTPTVLGSPTVTAMDAGTALCFDGTKDGLFFGGTNPIQGMAAFTIETLVYPEFTSGAASPRLMYIGDSATANRRLVIELVSGALGNWHILVGFSWNAATSTTIEDTNYVHPSGQWYWLAVTFDGQTARVYVNGVLENSANITFGAMATASISLANRPSGAASGSNFFPGCMRDVEFFNSALPVSQLLKP